MLESLFESLDEPIEEPKPKVNQKPKPSRNGNKKKRAKPIGTELVSVTKQADGTQQAKPVILVNELATIGEDIDTGKPIKAWVQRERQMVAREVLNTLKRVGVEVFNTNGFISCFDKSTNGWFLFDESSKIMVLIDTYIRCARGGHKQGNKVYEPVDTPKNVGEFLLYSKADISDLDRVRNVARHPYFDKNMKVVNDAGYNAETQWYLPESCVVEDKAWSMDLKEAYDIFDEAFGCMNYRSDTDKQADLAAFLTPPWRFVSDNTPIISVSANAPGSGKGLRQRICNSIWANDDGAVMSKPESQDELKKQLFACLRTGVGFLFVDNISNKLLSDVLATYATENPISDRAVYGRVMESYENNLIISVNGNNLRFSEDIATRLLPIYFEINESSLVKDYAAEGRKTQNEIISYAKLNRDKIIGASLRISKEFINDMCPNYPTGVSRYDTWRKYVLGSVYHMCETLEMSYLLDGVTIKAKIDADPESQTRATMFKAILDIIGLDDADPKKSKPFITGLDKDCGVFDIVSYTDPSSKRLVKDSVGHDIMGEFITGTSERSRLTQVGIYFRDIAVDKIHYGWRLVKGRRIRVKGALKTSYNLVLVNTKDFYEPGSDGWERPVHTTQQQDEPSDLDGISL